LLCQVTKQQKKQKSNQANRMGEKKAGAIQKQQKHLK